MKRSQPIAVLVGIAAMAALASPAHARLYMMMHGSNVYPGVTTPVPPAAGNFGVPHVGVNVHPSVPTPMPHPDGPNLYQYVRSNPGNRVDPQGLWGYATHYRATYNIAFYNIGFNEDCAELLAASDQGVDDWTPAWNPFATQFHFNLDVDGNPFPCGRDCWFKKRWDKGLEKLKKANVYWSPWLWDVSVTDGLAHIGAALHSRQDSLAHSMKHHAETPFDHAPDKLCLLWGDWFGIIYQRCIDARLTNPNWGHNNRPDDETLPEWHDDLQATLKDTEMLLRDIWKIPAVQCHCKKKMP